MPRRNVIIFATCFVSQLFAGVLLAVLGIIACGTMDESLFMLTAGVTRWCGVGCLGASAVTFYLAYVSFLAIVEAGRDGDMQLSSLTHQKRFTNKSEKNARQEQRLIHSTRLSSQANRTRKIQMPTSRPCLNIRG